MTSPIAPQRLLIQYSPATLMCAHL